MSVAMIMIIVCVVLCIAITAMFVASTSMGYSFKHTIDSTKDAQEKYIADSKAE